jgi:hypothetical protein
MATSMEDQLDPESFPLPLLFHQQTHNDLPISTDNLYQASSSCHDHVIMYDDNYSRQLGFSLPPSQAPPSQTASVSDTGFDCNWAYSAPPDVDVGVGYYYNLNYYDMMTTTTTSGGGLYSDDDVSSSSHASGFADAGVWKNWRS